MLAGNPEWKFSWLIVPPTTRDSPSPHGSTVRSNRVSREASYRGRTNPTPLPNREDRQMDSSPAPPSAASLTFLGRNHANTDRWLGTVEIAPTPISVCLHYYYYYYSSSLFFSAAETSHCAHRSRTNYSVTAERSEFRRKEARCQKSSSPQTRHCETKSNRDDTCRGRPRTSLAERRKVCIRQGI